MKWHRKKRNCIMMVALCLVLFSGCGRQVQMQQTYVSMGTVVSVVLYVEDETQGQEAQKRISRCLEELENQYLSYRIEGSEIWKINHSCGESVQISDTLYEYLTAVWDISERSGGALDVTVGEVTGLWNIDMYADAPEGFTVPTQEELAAALENVGYEKITLQQEMDIPQGMTLDLGAVGKGIACDEIKKILEEQGIPAAIVSVGGSNVIHGKKENGTGWTIGVAHPREEGSYLGYLTINQDSFVATSGDYERYVMVDGVRYHHIMDRTTGYPADAGLCSVTIVSDSGCLSDGLSTACFVLGKEKGMALAESYGAEALFVEEDGSVTMTEGMKSMWVAEY